MGQGGRNKLYGGKGKRKLSGTRGEKQLCVGRGGETNVCVWGWGWGGGRLSGGGEAGETNCVGERQT